MLRYGFIVFIIIFAFFIGGGGGILDNMIKSYVLELKVHSE